MISSNYLPPLEPIGDFRSYVCGEVVIDQTAAIAAGVLIQADQGGRVTIAAGVCIGMGTVIHAQDGLLEIGAGANLGAGVLVYGSSKIGEGACIGASSSIVRAVIAKGAIVPPCSLISGIAESPVAKEASPAIAEDATEYQTCQVNQLDPPTNHQTAENFVDSFVDSNWTATEHQIDRDANSFTPELNSNSNPESELNSNPSFTNSEATPPEQNPSSDSNIAEPTESSEQVSHESDLAALISVNSVQAKAHAQAQINRFIKRLQIN